MSTIIRRYAVAAASAVIMAASPAWASCKFVQLVELPVTVRDHEAIVDARFGSHDAQLIVDSGSETSVLSAAAARDLQLKTTLAPFRMQGTSDSASASTVRTNDFALAGVVLPGMTFVVGGADFGASGILGQDILGIADVDYDLPHGSLRLDRSDGCDDDALVSSAGLKGASVVPIEKPADRPYRQAAIVPVIVDGITLRAKLDTGSVKTTMTLAAAKRLGVKPDSPGVVETGYSIGIGGQRNTVWRSSFQSLQIGSLTIDRPTLYIEDMAQGVDMLLGFDFFIKHRVYVSNRRRKAYIAR